MPGNLNTSIIVVLDRSGSMADVRKDMEGGFDSFIGEQRKDPAPCDVTLVQFDTVIDTVYSAYPLARVPNLVLAPRGSTALYDAIGQTITKTGERFRRMPEAERPTRVLFLIVTDGQENASREFTAGSVREMIQHQTTKYGWVFSYLGADVDAFAESQQLGIVWSNASGYKKSAVGVNNIWRAASAGMSGMRGMSINSTPAEIGTSYSFSEADKARMNDETPDGAA